MGSADRDNYVCVNCGRGYGHKGKCDHCGHFLKADRLLSEEDSERLMEIAIVMNHDQYPSSLDKGRNYIT